MSKEEWIERIKSESISLATAPADICADIDVIRAAVTRDGMELQYASNILKNNKDIVIVAVRQNGLALNHVSIEITHNNIDICIAAVAQNATAIKMAPRNVRNRLREDRDIVMQLITISPHRLVDTVHPSFRNDRNFIREAIAQNSEILQYASDELRNDKNFIIEAIAQNEENVFQYASDDLRRGGLHEHIYALIRQHEHSLHELMNSANVTNKRAIYARKNADRGEADTAFTYHAPSHSKLFDHNQYHAQNIGKKIYEYVGVEDSPYDWETIKQVAFKIGIHIPKDKP